MAIVDTHVHVASDDQARYPRCTSDRGSSWWLRPGYSAPEVVARIEAAGVDRVVAAQAVGVYLYDNSYLLDAAAELGGRLSVVVAVDMDGPDPAGVLAELADRPGVVGVRLLSVFADDHRWASSPALDEVLAVAADRGLAVVLTVFGDALGPLRPAVAGRPEVPVALDHCAFPQTVEGRISPDQPVLGWDDLPHVHLKVSSHLFNELGADPARLVDQLAARFGASRLLWGSDYPQSAHESYGQLLDLGRHAARNLEPADRDAFLGANASRVFPPQA